ncbi:PepSY-associated TM helix domain-containing protein [Portibacter lacus]|uniref:DNA mismatch repair protein n=1 Tax=Portibacter lacus TaxID=1099794 RepID=A0AA37WEF9_9BACT|nr:PepSY-associated TM helix domain-containing protein [Portibacter lacus]GLR17277.1 hypothetical protein GCM10007940_18920 [Portibacter lacus]
MTGRKRQAKVLRNFRDLHRSTGALLFILFFVISISGLLLGWKKNSYGIIHPNSEVGVSSDLKFWMSFDDLQNIAFATLQDSIDKEIDLEIERVDARPDKGMVKFVFENHYWGVQLDGANGDVLAVTRRRADFIENVHDGAILDIVFNTGSGILKVIYSSITGLALLLFTVTGFWLWYGPKRMRRMTRKQAERTKA